MVNDLEKIAELLRAADDFTLIAHVSPDGDTLGSTLGLRSVLKSLGKRVQVVCDERVPAIYRFLPGADSLLTPEEARQTDCVISVDCADFGRMGRAGALFAAAKTTCCIDHHGTNDGFAVLNAVEENAAATGEIIFRLAHLLTERLGREVASCLYTALITDTGCFAYSNTTPKTFRTAGALLEEGVDVSDINRRIYRTIPFGKTKLLGVAINNMQLKHDGMVGVTFLTASEIASAGALEEDTEGIIDHVRDVDSVEVGILIRESGPDIYKVSLRSKLYADVAEIARAMGGGGHKRAAGYTAHGEAVEVYRQAVELAGKALEKEKT